MSTRKPLYDICICLGLLVFLAGFAMQVSAIPKNARGYPLFLLCASTLLTIALFGKAIKKQRQETREASAALDVQLFLLIFLYCIIIGVYLFLMNILGYLVTTFLFILGSLYFLHIRNWKLLVFLPIGLTLSMYALFTNFLMVTLPRGSWISLFF